MKADIRCSKCGKTFCWEAEKEHIDKFVETPCNSCGGKLSVNICSDEPMSREGMCSQCTKDIKQHNEETKSIWVKCKKCGWTEEWFGEDEQLTLALSYYNCNWCHEDKCEPCEQPKEETEQRRAPGVLYNHIARSGSKREYHDWCMGLKEKAAKRPDMGYKR